MFRDTFYFQRSPAGFVVDTSGFQPQEASTVEGHRWWPVEEIEASPKNVIPYEVAPLLRGLLDGRSPPAPVQLPWHH